MARYKCKDCGKTMETTESKCEICGGDLVLVKMPKKVKPKQEKFSAESDMGRKNPGDFTPVAVRAIKPKVPHRTMLDMGRQDKRTTNQKIKTLGFILGTLAVAFILAMSIRYFFGSYNVKFTDENVNKRQNSEQQEPNQDKDQGEDLTFD